MDTKKTEILYRDMSYKIVGLAMKAHRKLGYGFLEKVYEAAENLCDAHRAQTLNYLRATGLRLAILLNFGKEKLQYERLVN